MGDWIPSFDRFSNSWIGGTSLQYHESIDKIPQDAPNETFWYLWRRSFFVSRILLIQNCRPARELIMQRSLQIATRVVVQIQSVPTFAHHQTVTLMLYELSQSSIVGSTSLIDAAVQGNFTRKAVAPPRR